MQGIYPTILSHTNFKATALKENKNGKINCYNEAIQETHNRLSLQRNQKHCKVQREEVY